MLIWQLTFLFDIEIRPDELAISNATLDKHDDIVIAVSYFDFGIIEVFDGKFRDENPTSEAGLRVPLADLGLGLPPPLVFLNLI